MELSYVDFENRFRGASDAVKEEQRPYLRFFEGAPGPVVDLGCGRGEFLELLGEAGIPSWGVDAHPSMLEACRARNLDAREGSAVDSLEALSAESLGGIFMAHVIEHLPRPDVMRLIALAASRLRPNGTILVETLNPQCLFAHAPFIMDFTHEWPIHPQTLRFLLEAHRFDRLETVYRQYLPPEMLQLVDARAPAPSTPFETAAQAAFGRMQTIIDLAFKNFIYAMAAKRPGPSN